MRIIYKYPIEITDSQRIQIKCQLGTTYKIIHVGLDPQGRACVWIEHTPGDSIGEIGIRIVGTGNPMPEGLFHLGSFLHQSTFVWHVYAINSTFLLL